MKIVSMIVLIAGCGFAEGFSYLPAPPAVNLPSQAPELQALRLARTAETHEMIREAAERHQVPAAFVKSIVAAESNFNPDAVSPRGAIGLMQLMPATAEEYGADPRVPAENVDAGTRYLKVLLTRYKHSLTRVIAAYNAGPGVVDRYRGVPPYPETQGYVIKVLGLLREFQHERR